LGEDIICGIHAVTSVLERRADQVTMLWLDEQRHDPRMSELLALARDHRVTLRRVPRKKLDDLSKGERHQGVVARCQSIPVRGEKELKAFVEALGETPLLLVLDGVQDPHNLGACLRSADAAGVQAVVVPRDHSAPVSATVRRSASGAVESVPLFQVKNLARALEIIKDAGVWLLGATGEAEQSLFELDMTGPIAFVMGAEGQGLRRLTKEKCDQLLRLPMAGSVSSLNVSVATGICLYEAVRQRSR
jgi:23S rRNA (guanosine2251-2'-O)-methyltransferase